MRSLPVSGEKVFQWRVLPGQRTIGEKWRGCLEEWLEEEISSLRSSCPYRDHSKQTVHIPINSSIFPMCWEDPVTSAVQPPLHFITQKTFGCLLPSTLCGELGVQVRHLPWRGVHSSRADRPQTT